MSTSHQQREALRNETIGLFDTRYAPTYPRNKACVFWTAAFIEVCARHGVEAVIQAGTAKWTCLHPESPDDGRQPHTFGYQFDPVEAIPHLYAGNLPEMHAWVYLPGSNEIVDLTTEYQPQQMEIILGRQWDAKVTPPPYIWLNVEEINAAGVQGKVPAWYSSYEANPFAIAIVAKAIMDVHVKVAGFPYFRNLLRSR